MRTGQRPGGRPEHPRADHDRGRPGPTVYQQLRHVEPRHGNRSTNNAPRNIYPTADGSWVAVSTSAQRIAERVMELVGHPEVIAEPWFATGAGRAEHVDLLDAHVGDWIASRSRAEVLDAFEEAGAAIAPVYDAADLVNDPHVRETRDAARGAATTSWGRCCSTT